MAQEIADSTLLDTWASSGLIVEPDISKIIEGWQLGEQPPHEYMNWLQNTFGSKLNHILKNGVVKWNDETPYLAGSSVQHNGNIWLCKTTNTNSAPADANANWKRIITVESLTTVLGGYVALTGNQTIAGVKTFISSPIVPIPTTGTQAVNKDYVDDKYSGFKNLIINGRKQVNQSGLTTTDNAYNYDNHYKVGNNWFMFVEGKNIISGEPYTASWEGVATAGYYIGTAGALTINAQTFTAITNGETIIPTITSGQILWIKFASDSSGSSYNKVQFEPGTAPTPYEQRLKEFEEFLVQSCYEVIKIKDIRSLVGTHVTTLILGCVEKRAIPIINWNFSTVTNATSFSSSPTTNSINFSYEAVTTATCVIDGPMTADARPY